MAVTFALSIHTFIDDIGAYAGFAAAVGLALFALLLFTQARELKRLREWGAHTHDRIADLERRLAGALELARRANAPARAQSTGSVAQRPPAARQLSRAGGAPVPARTSAPSKLPLLPAAPAGLAGPSLGSATATIPRTPSPATPSPIGAPAAVPAAPTGVPAAPRQAIPATGPQAPVAQPAVASGMAPATAAAAKAPAAASPALGNGHAERPAPTLPPQRPGEPARPTARPPAPGARPAARPAPARPGQRPVRPGGAGPARPAAAPLRSRTPSATPRGGGMQPPEEPRGHRRLLLALGGVGVLAVVVVAVLALTGGGGDGGSSPAAGSSALRTTTSPSQGSGGAAPPHGKTTVGVLNGTLTQGLANTVATQLSADGFKTGQVTNASSQDRPVTVVSYYGGHEREAAEVAKTLGVSSDAVQAIDPDTEAKICTTGAGTCPETVVVTVGADRQ